MLDWVIQNKTWLFSGIAVAVPLTVIAWLMTRKVYKQKQIQKGGRNSTFIQAGHDINLNNNISKNANNGSK